jgi:hypothetical protein
VNRRPVLAIIAALAVGTVAVGPASAAPKPKPKPFKGSATFNDSTPDATASNPTSEAGCDTMVSQIPREAPILVKVPAAGKLKVTLNNQLDWALEIQDPAGNVLVTADGDMPNSVESATAKLKKAGTYKIQPCNIGGEPSVLVSWSYTPA